MLDGLTVNVQGYNEVSQCVATAMTRGELHLTR